MLIVTMSQRSGNLTVLRRLSQEVLVCVCVCSYRQGLPHTAHRAHHARADWLDTAPTAPTAQGTKSVAQRERTTECVYAKAKQTTDRATRTQPASKAAPEAQSHRAHPTRQHRQEGNRPKAMSSVAAHPRHLHPHSSWPRRVNREAAAPWHQLLHVHASPGPEHRVAAPPRHSHTPQGPAQASQPRGGRTLALATMCGSHPMRRASAAMRPRKATQLTHHARHTQSQAQRAATHQTQRTYQLVKSRHGPSRKGQHRKMSPPACPTTPNRHSQHSPQNEWVAAPESKG